MIPRILSRVRVDKRASASLDFRAVRPMLGTRQAYWFAVARHGWQDSQALALRLLNPNAKRALRLA